MPRAVLEDAIDGATRNPEDGRLSPRCHPGTRKVVGATGFEPATPCAQGRCATRLRYAPTRLIIPRPHGFLPTKDATRLRRSRGTVHSPESPGGHTGFGVRPCNRSGPQSIQSAMKTFVSPFTFA